ncbi:hypothetical protein BYT27DRAFT_7184553 [Phlegmacium glaucopus]|nr:hypothetical protein BYT27DRAFT_7184553 [Phlegmacium glaucopus]
MAAPPLTQSDAVTSLLSLSIAAASAPIPPLGANPTSSSPRQQPTQLSSTSKHHRRLGSTGKMRRRLSDAREACTRPLLASNPAALSLASLSLSASPPSTIQTTTSTSFGAICKPLAPKPHSNSIHIMSGSAPNPVHVSSSDNFSLLASAATAAPPAAAGLPVGNTEHSDTTSTTPIPISNGKAGAKKRGIDYKCESCSKVYRHPNCLNKHRWEHTRQWREASKFVLSKHQQVQLLEAAAILSFMGKQPASLPEDRSEWPSFLSGGSLPKVEPVGGTSSVPSTSTSASSIPSASSLGLPSSGISSTTSTSSLSHLHTSSTPTHSIHPISSSVPNPQPSGPRLHDYALKAPGGKVVVTQVRPGLLLGVNSNGDPSIPSATGTASYPMSMPVQQFTPTRTTRHGYGYDYGHMPVVAPVPTLGTGGSHLLNGNGIGNHPTWSLPNSSMRSVSHGRSLSSLSGSVSAQSEDGDIEIEIEDGDEDDEKGGYGRGRVYGRTGMGIDVEGDADGMDDEGEEDDDDDEHYGHNHGRNHERDEHHDNDDGDQTQNETHHHTHYASRYTAPRMDTASQVKPRWDGVGMDMDIDMDMD